MRRAGRQDLVRVVAAEGLDTAGDVDAHAVLAGAVLERGDAGNGLGSAGVLLLALGLDLLCGRRGVAGCVVAHGAGPRVRRGGRRLCFDGGQRHSQTLAALQLRLDGGRVKAVVELGVGGDAAGGRGCGAAGVEGLHKGRRLAAYGVAQAVHARLLQLCAARQVGCLLAGLLGGDVGVVLEPLLALERRELLEQRARRREGPQRQTEGRGRARRPQARCDGDPGRHADGPLPR